MAARAARVLEGMLLRGFTTVRDAGGADWGLAQAVSEGSILGPCLLFTGHALSQTGGHGDMRGKGEDCCACGAALRGIGRVCDGVPEVGVSELVPGGRWAQLVMKPLQQRHAIASHAFPGTDSALHVLHNALCRRAAAGAAGRPRRAAARRALPKGHGERRGRFTH